MRGRVVLLSIALACDSGTTTGGPCVDADGDGHFVACATDKPDCNDADPDVWSSCTTCKDEDGDQIFAGCDGYTKRPGPDCFDSLAAPSAANIKLSNLALVGTMESAGVRVKLETTLSDVTLASRICVSPGDQRWNGTTMFPVGTSGVQIGSFFSLPSDKPYEVEVVATSASTGQRATIYGTTRTRAETPPAPQANRVFVSPSGNDANTGTEASPFQTIAHAASLLASVDTIELLPGAYYEAVTLTVAGTKDKPKYLLGRAGAIIDGSDSTFTTGGTWTFDAGTSTYSAPITVAGLTLRNVLMDDERLYSYDTLAALVSGAQAGVQGGFYYDATGHILHVRLPDGSDPKTHAMHVAIRDVALYINRVGGWVVEGLEVRYFNGAGINVRGGANVWVRKNNIHHSNNGIVSNQPWGVPLEMPRELVIEDNQIRDTKLWDWGYLACKAHFCETTGILAWCSPAHVIRRNKVDGTFNGIGPTGGEEPVPTDVPVCGSDGDTYDNTITHVPDDGLELDGPGVNQRIFRNRIEHRHTNSVSLSPLTHGPTWVVRNIAIDWHEAFVKLRNDNDVGWKVVAHNTMIAGPDTTGYNFWPPACFDGLFAYNNILGAKTLTINHGKSVPCVPSDAAFFQHVVFDGNLHSHETTTSPLIWWEVPSYPTLAAFVAATGQEKNGIEQVPAYDADGVTPAVGSAMIDRAIPIVGINDRTPDKKPDIGAIER